MHERLSAFKTTLAAAGQLDKKLYFVKVDVQACFDSLPQDSLVRLAESFLTADEYSIGRHTEYRPVSLRNSKGTTEHGKPARKFHALATRSDDDTTLHANVEAAGGGRGAERVVVDGVVAQRTSRAQVVKLLREHVQGNMIRIGKRYYRQRRGIPQGSVLSSLLCSIGYADFERQRLGFLREGEPSLLMRLIDDFLLVTTSEDKAMRFLGVMQAGDEDHGISIRDDKTLTNFATAGTAWTDGLFPYCGVALDQHTLAVSRDSDASTRQQCECRCCLLLEKVF